MFAEYMPFTAKYFYHILVIVISFILFEKFFRRRPAEKTAQSGTHAFTAVDESVDSSESNVTVDSFMCEMLGGNMVVGHFRKEKRERMTKTFYLGELIMSIDNK